MMNTNHWLHKRNVLNGSKTFGGDQILFRYGFRLVELLRDRYMLLERLCHLCAHGCVRLRRVRSFRRLECVECVWTLTDLTAMPPTRLNFMTNLPAT